MSVMQLDRVDETAPPHMADDAPEQPYVGPRPFERQEEDRFFGREREGRDLVSLIIANRCLVLYSQSGAGKSSLLNTKVTVGLEQEKCWVLPTARVQGKLPESIDDSHVQNVFLANVALSLSGAFRPLASGASSPESPDLYKTTLTDFLRAIHATRPAHDEPLILFLDQFEELFTFYEHRWQDRETFINEIVIALEKVPDLRIVLSLREDYIAKLDAFRGCFPDNLRARYHLERLRENPAVRAVSDPAGRAGRSYAEGVAEAIVKDLLEVRALNLQGKQVPVTGEFVEPVQLQVVCLNLWNSVPKNQKLITKADLEQSGSVDEALRKFYDASIAEVARHSNITRSRLRRWFEDKLVTSAGTRGTVFRDTHFTAGLPNKVVNKLVDRHLIRGDWRAGAQWFEITHDRLLRPIRESNREWLSRRNRFRWAAAGLAGLVIAGGGVYGALALQRAQQVALAATLERSSNSATNLDLSLLLAVEAVRVRDVPSTRGNLLTQLQKAERLVRLGPIDARDIVTSVSPPATGLVVMITSDRRLLVWDAEKGQLVRSMPIVVEGTAINLFADAERVYVVSSSGVRSVATDQLTVPGTLVFETASSPIAERLLSMWKEAMTSSGDDSTDPNVLQRDLLTKKLISFAAGQILVSRGGELHVVAASDGTDVVLPRKPDSLEPNGKVIDLGLSEDAKFAFALTCPSESNTDKIGPPSSQKRAAISGGGSCGQAFATFWEVENKKQLSGPFSRLDQSAPLAIGGSGRAMWTAVGKSDGSIDVARSELSEDGTSKKETNIQLPASGSFGNLIFVENANRLVSISRGLVASWNITGPRRLERKIWDELPADISVAGTGRLAAISSRSIKVFEPDGQSWQLTDDFPQPSSTIDPIIAGLAAASLSKDGTQLLFGRLGTLDLWSVSSRRRLLPTIIIPGAVTSVAIDPIQNYIAAGFVPESFYATPSNNSVKGADAPQVPVLWSAETGKAILFVDLADDIREAKDTSGSRPGSGDKMAVGVGFYPDPRSFAVTVATGRHGRVNIYSEQDIRNRKDGTRVPLDSDPYFVAFSPDGKTIAVSQAGGEVVLIDSTTNNVIGKLTKSSGEIGRLAFSSDGTILAGQELDRGIALWDVASRSLLGSILRNRNRPLTGIAFRPGDRALVTGDVEVDGMVEYDLRLESWIAEACEVAQRALTNDERSLYGIAQGKGSCEPK